jgi:hypothetical protein
MSTDYSDIWDLGKESDCCCAGVYLNGICSNCNDHCTPEYEEERELMDVYRDVGMSPDDFI